MNENFYETGMVNTCCSKRTIVKVAFTLAELLITLSVIGVVAALTLPTLLTTIGEKVKENQVKVFENKLRKGTDLLNIENGIGPYYSADGNTGVTENFVKALSKHLKIVTICGTDNLKDCLPYETIDIGTDEPLKVEDIKTGAYFNLDTEDYPDTAGMVLADGTPMILAWNKNCPVGDPDVIATSGTKDIAGNNTTACIKGIYDLNGTKGPNKFGDKHDIQQFGGISLTKPSSGSTFACTNYTIDGETICVGNTVYVSGTDFTGINCSNTTYESNGGAPEDDKYCSNGKGRSGYPTSATGSRDYWASARKLCIDQGADLPDKDTLEKLYDNKSSIPVLANMGTNSELFWSSTEFSANGAYYVYFSNGFTDGNGKNTYGSDSRAVCVGK